MKPEIRHHSSNTQQIIPSTPQKAKTKTKLNGTKKLNNNRAPFFIKKTTNQQTNEFAVITPPENDEMPKQITSLEGFFDIVKEENLPKRKDNKKKQLLLITTEAEKLLKPGEYLIRPSNTLNKIKSITIFSVTYKNVEGKIGHTRGCFTCSNGTSRWNLVIDKDRIFGCFKRMMNFQFESYKPCSLNKKDEQPGEHFNESSPGL